MADIGEHMQAFCESNNRKTCVKRALIGSMHGEGILILTPLLKKYMEMGLKVTRVHRFISFNGKAVFEWFTNEVCDARRRADLGGADLEMLGEGMKTMGNCGYGGTLLDPEKHTTISFAKEKNIAKHVNNPRIKNCDKLNEAIYEVEKQRKTVVYNRALQIGVAVYSYAKLRMLEFWEVINKYLVNDQYQLMEMDTDSLYIAFARDTLDECVKPELREEWATEKWKWFSSDDNTTTVSFEGQQISLKQWDKRTPGKFKIEYDGTGQACLNSKVYTCWGAIDKDGKGYSKTSCKGAQQRRNELTKDHFLSLLHTTEAHTVENAGFIKDDNGIIKTYTQKKTGMSYYYFKRKVLADGVSTTHLDI